MQKAHGSDADMMLEEAMLRCNISNASWEEPTLGTKAMLMRNRPIHSGFETLRLAGLSPRSTEGYHSFGSATNEQLTASAFGRRIGLSRPTAVFADFRER